MITSLPLNLEDIKGGVDAVVVNLMRGFEQFPDSRLLILSLAKSDHHSTVQYAENINIQYLPKNRRFGGNLFDFLFYAYRSVGNMLDEFKPDVIHIQGGTPVLFCLRGLKRDNIVITQHGIMAEEIKYQKGLVGKLKFWAKKLVERYYFPFFKNYIFISRYNQRFLEGIRRNIDFNGTLIFNPVNPEFFNLRLHRKFSKRILYVGVINQRKNLMCLLQALNRMKEKVDELCIEVVGGFQDDSYRDKIYRYIEENDLHKNVKFLGWKSQDEILRLYEHVDILVLPSLQESLPVSIAEAMAAGRPVIASNVGGVAEMFTCNQSGFVFEANNAIELEKYLLKFCFEEQLYPLFAGNAREEAMRKFHPQSVVKQTLEFYRTILYNYTVEQ